MNQNKKPQIVIFLTVFIYLLGFGIVIPIIPMISTQYGATAFQTGLLLSVYSLMQFIFSPVWGRLSDKYGRRPILLSCLFGEIFAYLLFAQAKNIEMLFAARILSGFFGASISTASAYISDITPANERSKGMALVGAAFGLGFLFGPAIGGGLTIWAGHISNDPFFKSSFSAYWVAGLCLVTFLFAFRYLKETLNKDLIDQNKLSRFQALTKYFAMPTVGPLIFVFFLSSFGMSTMEATLVLFMKNKFNWGLMEVSFGFAYVGLMIVITQGVLVRRLIPKFGERNILRLGLVLMSLGFLGIAAAHSLFAMAVTQTFLALGVGFVNPSTLGSISLLTDAKEQGSALGTTQSMASLGRIIGPALGGALFGSLNMESPFIFAGLFTMIGLMVVIAIFKSIPVAGQQSA
jgi:DHA1 family tetracycline resistance protein-like MFS transporter